jgi:UDP-N-acetylmuramyl pentapeptide phosphotransferase/UDP-N-acetylglucosamine-1-phosphate transferase
MKYQIALIVLGIISLISSLCLTKILIKMLTNYGVVDIPSNRRIHLRPTPRGGGLGFIIIFSVLLPSFEYFAFGDFQHSRIILPVLLPISFVSLWDDVSHVLIPLRLLIHIFTAILAIMWLVHPSPILHSQIPVYLDLAIGSFALLTFINLYNFLDGIDGITVSETMHLSLTILILCFLGYDIIPNVDVIIIISIIILGWAIGFVFFNWSPAKIFIGDVGSISLGLLLGICLLSVAVASIKLFVACVIASLYYVADGGVTLLTRLVRREKIWQPHLQHFFQKAVQGGRTHKQVVQAIIKCNFILMLFSINSLYYPVLSAIGALLTITITLIRLVP